MPREMSVSACITSYNQERFLAAALDSVLAQSRRPNEVIIVDDASTDGSRDIIAACVDRNPGLCKAVFLERNQGVAAARNLALERAACEFVVFLDGDDRWLPAKLERELAVLERDPSVQFVFSDINYIDAGGAWLCRWAEAAKPPEGDVFIDVFARRFPRGNLFRNELVRLAAWREVGEHDVSLGDLYEDFDMKIRLSERLRCRFVDAPLNEYRLHGGGLSRRDSEDHYAAIQRIFRKNLPLLAARRPEDRQLVERTFHRLLRKHSMRAAGASFGRGEFMRAARQVFRTLRPE